MGRQRDSHRYDYLVARTIPERRAWSHDTPAHFYWCPSGDARTTQETDYVAVVGPHTAWPGHTGRRLAEITDEASTVLLVEVADSGIHWMEPRTRRWRSTSPRAEQPSSRLLRALRGFPRAKGPKGRVAPPWRPS
ncbi:MAG: hypothetical protein WKF75_21480 [Singulisphaera sp.]